MDIVKAFAAAGLAKGVTIHIQGTVDEPLFQANQIGDMLGMANIRDALRHLGPRGTRVSITDTSAGPRTATFLTEFGLYRLLMRSGCSYSYTLGGQQQTLFLTDLGLTRLLGQSRKPIAKPFQKWVAKVIKEYGVRE